MNNKAIPFNLQTTAKVTVYDQTKVTLLGRANEKTFNGKQVFGPPLNDFTDTTLPVSFTPVHGYSNSVTGRIMTTAAVAAGLLPICLHTFNFVTGKFIARVGRINMAMPAGTNTIRSITFTDPGTTGWRIEVLTLNSTTAALSGLFMATSIALADFSESPPTIPAATTGDTEASKKVFHLIESGGSNLMLVPQCHTISRTNGLIRAGNNAAATFQVYSFDPTAAITTVTASGQTADCFIAKTGTLASIPVTILLLNSFNIITPTTGPNAGFECLFIGGSVQHIRGRVSELTAGATTWPSIEFVNVLDVPNMNTAVTPATAHFSDTLQRAIWQQISRTAIKQWVNNSFEFMTGEDSGTQFRTGLTGLVHEFGAVSIGGSFEDAGFLFFTCTTAGQIGILSADLRSNNTFAYSRIITPVIDIKNTKMLSLVVQKAIQSAIAVRYRVDDFTTENSGTWITAPEDGDFSGIAQPASNKIQVEFMEKLSRTNSTIPVQVLDAHFIVDDLLANNENWRLSFKDSQSISPFRVGFGQSKAYTGSKHYTVTLYKRSDNSVLFTKNTQDNPTDFELSVNNGTSFSALAGAIASSPLLNVLVLKWGSPSGDEVDAVIKEKT